ncbi:endo alpha-1,4 polygalactosaminidase [Lentzea sp. NPDC059081]|uniref:endo alpha-1,4 polygalactosaminidase n=1 Tax=Lentzea sp. NPDC059081 TaxID=3346719 RepID=UPI00369F6D0A
MKPRSLLGIALAVLVAAGCADEPSSEPEQAVSAPPTAPGVQLPPEKAILDYQLGAAYPPPEKVTLVVRDSTAEPARGLYSVCYVNGFQSQPNERDVWLGERKHLLLGDSAGKPVVDPKWPDEFLLDTSTPAARGELAAIFGATIDQCAAKGFQAVEIDNLDSFLRSDGRLKADDNLAYAKALAERAHGRGLAIGQKNSAEQAGRGRAEVGFDFAVTEECHRWSECSSYTDVYGTHVMDIEYTDDLRGTFGDVCADPATPATTTLRDRLLVAAGGKDYSFQHC